MSSDKYEVANRISDEINEKTRLLGFTTTVEETNRLLEEINLLLDQLTIEHEKIDKSFTDAAANGPNWGSRRVGA